MTRLNFAVTGLLGVICLTAHAEQPPLRLGVLTDMSGVYSEASGPGSVIAAELAIEDAGKEVLGRRIELISANHQNKNDLGVTMAREWYDVRGVSAIFDLPGSAMALAVARMAAEKQRVLITVGSIASDLTGSGCAATSAHWGTDTYALSKIAGSAMARRGAKSWYFITADYAFGKAMERDATDVLLKEGGTVVGSSKAPMGSADFSSYLVSAINSSAKVIALANAGGDTQAAVKQAQEFGLQQKGKELLALSYQLTDVSGLGLGVAQNLIFSDSWYWDLNEPSRQFATRFLKKAKKMPTGLQAGVYSAVLHYIRAVKAAGTDDASKVMEKVRSLKVDDFYAEGGYVRVDGRLIKPMYLFQVKTPSESKAKWDYFKVLAKLPGEDAFRPMSEGNCPLAATH